MWSYVDDETKLFLKDNSRITKNPTHQFDLLLITRLGLFKTIELRFSYNQKNNKVSTSDKDKVDLYLLWLKDELSLADTWLHEIGISTTNTWTDASDAAQIRIYKDFITSEKEFIESIFRINLDFRNDYNFSILLTKKHKNPLPESLDPLYYRKENWFDYSKDSYLNKDVPVLENLSSHSDDDEDYNNNLNLPFFTCYTAGFYHGQMENFTPLIDTPENKIKSIYNEIISGEIKFPNLEKVQGPPSYKAKGELVYKYGIDVGKRYKALSILIENASSFLNFVPKLDNKSDQPVDFISLSEFLNDEGKSLIPFLTTTYQGRQPQDYAILIYVLHKLKFMKSSSLLNINLSNLRDALCEIFTTKHAGSRENLRKTIQKLEASTIDYKDKINKCTEEVIAIQEKIAILNNKD
jgi:hypothetical protein